MTIEVYPAEIELGIADLVAKGSVSFASAIKPSERKLTQEELFAKFTAIANANPNQLDLYYKHSILASVGWNKNDDVFTKEPTWNARNTVADKQLNLGHNELNIVGHMTNSCVLDAKGNLIPDNTDINNVPDMFDVVSEFVLYKIWADDERRAEIIKVINDIENGDGFVSMECRFPAFDYAVIDAFGNQKVIPRNSSTAFLSQHLRAFGGTGEYQDYRVGRLLKDFFFTGQGIVTNPANERSIIFDSNNKPFVSKGSITIRDNKMDLEKQVAELTAQLAVAKTQLAQFAEEQTRAKQEANAAAQQALLGAKAELETSKTALEGTVATLTATVASKDTAIATLTEELKTQKEAVTIAKAEVESMKCAAKKSARASKLAAAGVASEKIEAEVAKWDSLNDEQFDSIVAMFPPKKGEPEPDADDKKKKEAKAADDKDAEAGKDCEVKTKADLSKAELEAAKVGNTGADTTPSRASVFGDFLSSSLPYSANASARKTKETQSK